MTTTPTAPAPVRRDDRPDRVQPPLFPLLAGGLITGAGLGFLIDDLPGGFTVATGLMAAGVGLVLRSVARGRRSRLRAALAALAIVLGAGAFGAALTSTSADVRAAVADGNSGDDGRAGAPVTREQQTLSGAVSAVTVDITAGDIDVRESDTDAVTLTTTTWSRRAEVSHRVDGDELVVSSDCGRWTLWFDDDCRVDVDLHVPAGTAVAIDQDAGSIGVTDASGSVRVDTGAADVTLHGLRGDLDVSTGAGAVTARDLASRVATMETGAGDIDLAWAARPDEVDISTGVGEVDVLVPAGAYRYEVETGIGSARTDGLRYDAAADARIDIYTGAGSATVTGRG